MNVSSGRGGELGRKAVIGAGAFRLTETELEQREIDLCRVSLAFTRKLKKKSRDVSPRD